MIKEKTYSIVHRCVDIDFSVDDPLRDIIKEDIEGLKDRHGYDKDIRFVTWYGRDSLVKIGENLYQGDITLDYLQQEEVHDGRQIESYQ